MTTLIPQSNSTGMNAAGSGPSIEFPINNNEPRDASAAAVIASALLELSAFASSDNAYFKSAETILKNLSSDKYMAKVGENGFLILKHSTGNWPKQSEVDTPLSYADYYFIEGLLRYKQMKK